MSHRCVCPQMGRLYSFGCALGGPFQPGFPCSSDDKESACNAGDLGSIPGSGRSLGEAHDNPLKYSCPENSLSMREEPGKVQSMGSQGVRIEWTNPCILQPGNSRNFPSPLGTCFPQMPDNFGMFAILRRKHKTGLEIVYMAGCE
ncbi:unnamed protein product [Rangifer tarandus platyrhynchus]|uniref:Uncharacterized protein n=1 Tax=Rangifer tarandus platyrhynchus TaxID=3082113 RepID=A0ABN8XPE3_RANTA|nr:unnamed protein product [Rangifer tarandus platyrhynchus]CAI9150838.1 unnamed protein product [Rangifer tarandus platyrhynchus]